MDVNSTSPNVDTPALLTTAHRPGRHARVTTDTNRPSICARTDKRNHPFPSPGGSVSGNPRPGSPGRRCTRPAGRHACDPSATPPVLSHLPRHYPAETTGPVRTGGGRGNWSCARHLYLQETPREDCEAEPVQVFRKCASKTVVTTCNKHSFALHLKSRGTRSNV